MNRKKRAIIVYVLMAVASSGIMLPSCSEDYKDGSVIFTQIVDKTANIDNLAPETWRYKLQSRIASIDPEKPEKAVRVLTEKFYSALSPHVSYDGKFLLFAGQLKQADTWQIWEMNLKNSEIRQVTSSKENCTDPAYLPLGRIVFSSSVSNEKSKPYNSLFTCNIDGSNLQKITFNPYTYSSSTVLKDGRVLAITNLTDSADAGKLMMVLRPDGTKNELFYDCNGKKSYINQVCETNTGRLIFIEYGSDIQAKGNLVSVSYNRPLHSLINYSSELKGSFQSVSLLNSGMLLVTYSPAEGEKYSVTEFDADNKTFGKLLYKSSDYDITEAVIVEQRERPRKLPSEVDSGVKTGLILCQDINFLGIPTSLNTTTKIKADRIEIIGVDSTLGVVKVEKDGSVYLKVIADTPFRIRTLDENGNILGETCDWIYIRPNERRGCIGCHEDPEIVPENKLSLAVKKAPLVIPVHKSNLKEKAIELE